MKLVSWNVNGFRACLSKGFEDIFNEINADVFCIQETKMQPDQADFSPEGYVKYFFSAERKGYSGTAVYTKMKPINVVFGVDSKHMDEGRVITCEFDNFYLLCCYTPNAQNELKRIGYRMEFEDDLREYMLKLNENKPVVLCGDLNVAHTEIDLKNPKTNRGNAGFSDEERGKFSELLEAGFTDSWRYKHPEVTGVYSWWSYRFNARKNNAGWRIDYFVVSDILKDKIVHTDIYTEVYGSDHCPVELELDI
ncbi:MAG: exodeoxyribonuclease III [Ruminococcus sp.]|jgi:exodeoxyribonuclease-3|nr:exodeoxyribonuclease III [Ruminococcus sp.]